MPRARPLVGILSVFPSGQMQARRVEMPRDPMPPPRRRGEGIEAQNQSSWTRAAKRVRKSLMETLR